jgi:hypothetical protein
MGIASFSSTGLLGSFQGLVGWFTAGSISRRAPHTSAAARANACASYTPTGTLRPAAYPQATPQRPQRPLRVLRVMDAQPSGTGRMRISGRMADVCAELDRLAALEAGPRVSPLLQ